MRTSNLLTLQTKFYLPVHSLGGSFGSAIGIIIGAVMHRKFKTGKKKEAFGTCTPICSNRFT